jgi:hypothetical protein
MSRLDFLHLDIGIYCNYTSVMQTGTAKADEQVRLYLQRFCIKNSPCSGEFSSNGRDTTTYSFAGTYRIKSQVCKFCQITE